MFFTSAFHAENVFSVVGMRNKLFWAKVAGKVRFLTLQSLIGGL